MSPKQLGEIQTRLQAKKKSLEERIHEIGLDDPFLNPDHVNDNAVDTDVRDQIGHDTVQAKVLTLTKELGLVEGALKRSFEGKYGICVNCQKPIDQARLDLIPEAEHCIECHGKIFTSRDA